MKIQVLIAYLTLLIPLQLVAGEHPQCPKKLAIIANSVLVEATLESFKTLYLKLGCRSEFSEFPGRRGILYFNKSIVDGEFYRLPLVEGEYSRPFVRSAVPLFYISNVLWLHPDKKARKNLPIGYVHGIVWEEKYMKNRAGVAFFSSVEMYDSYQKGRISGFLSSSHSFNTRPDNLNLHPIPIFGALISKLPLFHYLGTEHTDFMKQISELLINENPFNNNAISAD